MVFNAIGLLLTLLIPPGMAAPVTASKPQLDLRLANNAQLIVFSPDSREAATAGRDGPIILWDVRSGEVISTIQLPNHESVRAISFTYDGRALASASNTLDDVDSNVRLPSGHACLWDAATGKQLHGLSDKTWAMGLVCSRTKDLVAVREVSMTSLARDPGSAIPVYSGRTGALVSEIPLDSQFAAESITFANDGSALAFASQSPMKGRTAAPTE